MRKLWFVFMLVVLAFPAAAPAKRGGGEHGKSAAKHCRALRADMGADKFRATFGGKHGKNAFGRCVAAERKAARSARKRARKACREQGLHGADVNRCVRKTLAEQPATTSEDYKKAADQCEAERTEDPNGFAEEYGDGPNAFSKCVAEEIADNEDGPEIDEPETGDDQGDAPEPSGDDDPPGDERDRV